MSRGWGRRGQRAATWLALASCVSCKAAPGVEVEVERAEPAHDVAESISAPAEAESAAAPHLPTDEELAHLTPYQRRLARNEARKKMLAHERGNVPEPGLLDPRSIPVKEDFLDEMESLIPEAADLEKELDVAEGELDSAAAALR